MRFFFLLFLALAFTGCQTAAPSLDVGKMMEDYYGQTREYTPLAISGVSEFTLRGSNMTFIVEAAHVPLSIRSNDPTTAQRGISALEKVATFGLLGYFGQQAISDLSTSRNPLVVNPQVVNPVVVTQ